MPPLPRDARLLHESKVFESQHLHKTVNLSGFPDRNMLRSAKRIDGEMVVCNIQASRGDHFWLVLCRADGGDCALTRVGLN